MYCVCPMRRYFVESSISSIVLLSTTVYMNETKWNELSGRPSKSFLNLHPISTLALSDKQISMRQTTNILSHTRPHRTQNGFTFCYSAQCPMALPIHKISYSVNFKALKKFHRKLFIKCLNLHFKRWNWERGQWDRYFRLILLRQMRLVIWKFTLNQHCYVRNNRYICMD